MITTRNLHEDMPTMQYPQPILQVERFLTGDADPAVYLSIAQTVLPQFYGTVFMPKVVSLRLQTERKLLVSVQEQLAAAAQERKDGNTKATKPAELWRKYSASLRAVRENGASSELRTIAQDLLQELFLSQSLSTSELETPDWIDPYTGELDPTYEPDWKLDSLADLMNRVELVSPMSQEAYTRALQLKTELGWTDAEVKQFLRAQSGNDGWDGDTEEFLDDRGIVSSAGEQGSERDGTAFTINSAAFAIATPAMSEFNRWRTETFEHMKKNGTNGAAWKQCFLNFKSGSEAVAKLIETIAEVAHTYDVTTATAIALKVEGEYGLTEEDLDGIGGLTTNGVYYQLNDYIAEWGQEVLEIMNDSLSSHSPTSDIETFDEGTLEKLNALLPEKDHNPMITRSYVMAYMSAIAAGATLGEAENSAMAEWREAMSPKGAEAYRQTWKQTKKATQAMRAFWQHCGPSIPRPQEHIKAIKTIGGRPSGLILNSGRVIDWNIARMKAQGGELAWHPGQKDKLKTILSQNGLRNLPLMKYLG